MNTETRGILATIFITAFLVFMVVSIEGCHHKIEEEDKFILGEKVPAPYGWVEMCKRKPDECK